MDPGRTSTRALTNVTIPALLAGVNLKAGKVTNAAVAQTFGLELAAA